MASRKRKDGAILCVNKLRFSNLGKSAKPDEDQMHSTRPLLRKMFENQDGDWKMVGSDGEAFSFHENVLKEQVGRFRAIFAHPETEECIMKRIVVPPEVEMTGHAVEAFLRYVYYQDTAPMHSSFGVTSAIIRAGHYYDIPKMVDATNEVLYSNGVRNKKPDWHNFEELWKLYQQVWLWEEGHPSKKNLMGTLVAIIKEVSKSNATTGSVSTANGPLRDLIGTIVQENHASHEQILTVIANLPHRTSEEM